MSGGRKHVHNPIPLPKERAGLNWAPVVAAFVTMAVLGAVFVVTLALHAEVGR